MYQRILRKDGSVIILLPKTDTKAITFETLYKVGSRNEDKKNNGVSHFVEHLMFKGTSKRPSTMDISKELDGVGAEYNAFTGKDHTGYYIKADSRHLPMAIEMLADMLHNSKFDKAEMDKERGVIIEEIKMYEENPLMHIEDVFESLIFQNTVLGQEIAGPKVNIQTISRDALYSYYQKYYYSGNLVLSLAGNFKVKEALALINKFFPVKKTKPRVKIEAVKKPAQKSPQINIINQPLEQVQMIWGWPSVNKKDKKFLPLQVLANILGGNMSSRLFLQIRERRGLCYSIRAGVSGYEDISSFNIQAGLNKDKIEEALIAIKEEVNKIKTIGVSAEELKQAKENIRGRLILRLENPSAYLGFLSDQELFGQKIKTLEDLLKAVDKISLKQINDMAKEVFVMSQSNLALIGPFKDKSKFLKFLN